MKFEIVPEMRIFRDMLEELKVDWVDASDRGDLPICRTHFWHNNNRWSVINGFGSYGGYYHGECNKGLLEIYDWNSEPTGYLTAKEAIAIIFGGEEDG